jgi:hypothetical protein
MRRKELPEHDPLARYERGVMALLFLLAAALFALIIWPRMDFLILLGWIFLF